MAQMNTYIKLFLFSSIAILLFVLGGCQKNENGKTNNQIEFMAQKDFGVYGNNVVFRYNEQTCQYSINYSKKEFRMMSDNGEYITDIKFSTFPKKMDDIIETSVSYIKSSKLNSFKLTLTIVDIKDGKMWLWDNNQQMGIIIPYITKKEELL